MARQPSHVLTLAAVWAVGCYGGVLPPPSGFEQVEGEWSRACPDLGGVYLARSRLAAVASTVDSRHLSQFFTGVERAESLERVAIDPSPGQLALEFRGDAGPRRLALQEGVDFRCEGGRYRLLGSARVKHRDGATVHFYRGTEGALVAETLIDSPTEWLLLLPVLSGKQDGEWNSFAAAREAP